MKPVARFIALFLWAILLIAIVGIAVSLAHMVWLPLLAWAIVAGGAAAGLIRLQHRPAGSTRNIESCSCAARPTRQSRQERRPRPRLTTPATTHPRAPAGHRWHSSRSHRQGTCCRSLGRDALHRESYSAVCSAVFSSAGSSFVTVVAIRGESVHPNSALTIGVLNAPGRAIDLSRFDTPDRFLQGRVLRCALGSTVVEKSEMHSVLVLSSTQLRLRPRPAGVPGTVPSAVSRVFG